MKPLTIYAIIWLIANIGVYYGIIKPWREKLQAKENLPVGDITIDSLINTEEYLLPYYFSITDAEPRTDMAITRKKYDRYLRPKLHTYTDYTYYFGLAPVVEKGQDVKGQPVLVWLVYYDNVNIRDTEPFTALPMDFEEWRKNGALFEIKNYKYFNNKEIWEQMLDQAYKKYGMIPIAPEQLFFVSPVIKEKVDWTGYNKMLRLLIILDVIMFLPVIVFYLRR